MSERIRPRIVDHAAEPQYDIFEHLRTLQTFPELPVLNHVTLCEINTEFHTTFSPDVNNPAESTLFTPLTNGYIRITDDLLKPTISRKIPSIPGSLEGDGVLIRTQEQSMVKAAWDGLKDGGLDGALNGIVKAGAPLPVVRVLNKIFSFYRSVTNVFGYLNASLYPHLKLPSKDVVELFAPVRSWKRCWMKAISWHPSYPIFALALNDDTIRVIGNDLESIILLKHADQVMVSCLAWRPFSSELAVGVVNGILTWNVKTTGKSLMKLHKPPFPSPVTSVDYNETGRLLVSSSAIDGNLLIWNANSWIPTKVRTGGGGIPRALWSNNNIFCSTPSSLFRIWTYGETLTSRKWNTAEKRIEAFAWSPCGSMILFCSDCIIYSLSLKPSEIELLSDNYEPKVAPLFNLKTCSVRQCESELKYIVGGRVLQMEWDITGNRLAILFSDSELVPVFRVERKANTVLAPVGFIRGHTGEVPVGIAFQKNFKEGALLTIAWSSKRIQYFPMIFGEPSRNLNLNNQEPKFYLNYQNLNLTRMAGVTHVKDAEKVAVDFGPSFSQPHIQLQQQSNISLGGLGESTRNVPELQSPNNLKLFSL